MTPFGKALEFVIAHEGGYVNDPRDSGGETNMGISKRAYPDEDIQGMTYARAAEIYKRDYWDKCGCDKLPSPIAVMLFDGAVNQGPQRAVRALQAAVGANQDGIVGVETIQACRRLPLKQALSAFAGRRSMLYAIHPQLQVYGYGWFRRLAECLTTAMEPL